jgi:hypothetical protein
MGGDIYSINFNQQANDLMPPDKRKPPNLLLSQSLFSSLQWMRDLLFGSYKVGSTAPQYSPGAYNQYQQVLFKKQVFESLIDNNNDVPTTSNWRLIQSNFIGVDERIKFNNQKCVFEYALNKRFGGQFRMLPAPTPADIYISNLPPSVVGFRIGKTVGSTIGQTTSSDTIGSPFPFQKTAGFQINFKASLFALTSNQEVRDFADLYNAIGINYNIITY